MKQIPIILSAVFLSLAAKADTVTLGWQASTSLNVAGYKLYQGGAPGSYTNTINVGNVLVYTFNNVLPGKTYYFAATSYYSSGTESAYSVEVGYTVPGTNYTVAASANPVSGGTVTGDTGNWYVGKVATLTATANPSFVFRNWTEGASVASTTNVYTFTVGTSNRVLVANFTPLLGPPTNLRVVGATP